MICKLCRQGGYWARVMEAPSERGNALELHDQCPELARQANPLLTPTELAGGSRCDCRHQVPELSGGAT